MKALVVYCHPHPESFTAAVLRTIREKLDEAGADTRVIDLYADQFYPVLSPTEWQGYENTDFNTMAVRSYVEALQWCDTLIFVYPTWWYSLPAMLKGWLDRVLLPGVAFSMPDKGDIKPELQHIIRLGVFTTCGASWWLTRFIGFPGRRVVLRGVRLLCSRRLKTAFCAHYSMDSSTPATRKKHLERVARTVRRLCR